MTENNKDKIEILSKLAEICPDQEVKLTLEDIKTIEYAKVIMWKYQKIQDIMEDDLEAFHSLDREPYRLARIKEIIKM